ncbi:MAG: hypothetical protein LBE92_03870 [Chryseobacterium sp.]|jgi:hypothetical protein|uniref:hypothetical protein n=1 Tax=Chryseobacterium sp. TaxID=1871047 RepID=UPI0028232B28|nr:hypothetical protein [Chryseobacterium sp.]MDR2235239.1 hypothetical protein [Chryseobacterium sp.]
MNQILNRICVLFLPFLFSGIISAQSKGSDYIPYYAEIYKADSLFMLKKYDESYPIMDQVFQKYKPVNVWFVDASRNYLVSKSKVSQVDYKDIENYLRQKAYDTNAVFKDKEIVEILEKFNLKKEDIQAIVKENIRTINWPVREELAQMTRDDQKVRTAIKNNDSIVQTDRKHSERLKEIITMYGFPGKKVTGEYLVEGQHSGISLELLFNHMSYNGDYKYFKQILPEFIKKGSCSPFIFATMEDRRNEIENKAPDYYVIAAVPPDADRKEINRKRRLIGMPSLEYQEFKIQALMAE